MLLKEQNKLCLPGKTLKKLNRGYLWAKEQPGWRTERKDFSLSIFYTFGTLYNVNALRIFKNLSNKIISKCQDISGSPARKQYITKELWNSF